MGYKVYRVTESEYAKEVESNISPSKTKNTYSGFFGKYKKIIRICALIMAVSGLVIIVTSVYPILSYEWTAEQKYPKLISSLVDSETASFKFSDKDYTKASSWFGTQKDSKFASDVVSFYTITIPKLKIDNATVSIGGENLEENLVQYPGTVNPGKTGNTVIFGHSILPQYFNPKNYLSIFSTLPSLRDGDFVYINYDAVMYKYEVFETFEVNPTDFWVLDQDENESYLSLITCSPPGHPLKPKRLVVKLKLIES